MDGAAVDVYKDGGVWKLRGKKKAGRGTAKDTKPAPSKSATGDNKRKRAAERRKAKRKRKAKQKMAKESESLTSTEVAPLDSDAGMEPGFAIFC